MSGKFQIAIVVFTLLEAIVLSTGTIVVFATSLQSLSAMLIPVLLGAGTVLSLVVAWMIAPALDARLPSYNAPSNYRLG